MPARAGSSSPIINSTLQSPPRTVGETTRLQRPTKKSCVAYWRWIWNVLHHSGFTKSSMSGLTWRSIISQRWFNVLDYVIASRQPLCENWGVATRHVRDRTGFSRRVEREKPAPNGFFVLTPHRGIDKTTITRHPSILSTSKKFEQTAFNTFVYNYLHYLFQKSFLITSAQKSHRSFTKNTFRCIKYCNA